MRGPLPARPAYRQQFHNCNPKLDFLDCLKTVAERAELENFWLHKFRATFATRCLWAGVDLRTVWKEGVPEIRVEMVNMGKSGLDLDWINSHSARPQIKMNFDRASSCCQDESRDWFQTLRYELNRKQSKFECNGLFSSAMRLWLPQLRSKPTLPLNV